MESVPLVAVTVTTRKPAFAVCTSKVWLARKAAESPAVGAKATLPLAYEGKASAATTPSPSRERVMEPSRPVLPTKFGRVVTVAEVQPA